MEKHYLIAIESLGKMILEQRNELRFKEYELDSLRKELDNLKTRIREFELNS